MGLFLASVTAYIFQYGGLGHTKLS